MNKELITQAREAIDNMDDFARMANVVATGPLLVLNSAIDALELADKRIAELESSWVACHAQLAESCDARYKLERKLDVAREALLYISQVACSLSPEQKVSNEALAQIGGEEK